MHLIGTGDGGGVILSAHNEPPTLRTEVHATCFQSRKEQGKTQSAKIKYRPHLSWIIAVLAWLWLCHLHFALCAIKDPSSVAPRLVKAPECDTLSPRERAESNFWAF